MRVTLLIAIVFISTGVMGQSKPFDLGELISLLDKDKFEVVSAAMAKDYELPQNEDNTVYLTGFNESYFTGPSSESPFGDDTTV